MSKMMIIIMRLVILGVIVLFGTGLWRIVHLLEHERGRRALVLGIVLMIAFPVCLDRLILHQWYIAIPVESSRRPEEWMDFLGSYLGVIGTIAVGALAYWQTRVNRKQDQEIEKQKENIEIQNQEIRRLQAQLAAYQTSPAIGIKSGELKVYAGERKCQTNENRYSAIYHSMHGVLPSDKKSDFVHIRIPFWEKGLIPIEQICIRKLEWLIADRVYEVELKNDNYAELSEELQILIDSGDEITRAGGNENCAREFVDAMMTHQENSTIGKNNFSQSRLTIVAEFTNQIAKVRSYQLNYFIQSNQEADRLYLEHPNVTMIEKEE